MAGNATGERIKGSTYRQIVRLAIEGHTINQISRTANVQWETAKAIITRESKSIVERKSELADQCYRIAFQATEQLEDNLHKIAPAQLATVAGIMTDKVIALTQEPINQINQHLHLHLQPSNMIEQFNELVDKINASPAIIEASSDMLETSSDMLELHESSPQFHESSPQFHESSDSADNKKASD